MWSSSEGESSILGLNCHQWDRLSIWVVSGMNMMWSWWSSTRDWKDWFLFCQWYSLGYWIGILLWCEPPGIRNRNLAIILVWSYSDQELERGGFRKLSLCEGARLQHGYLLCNTCYDQGGDHRLEPGVRIGILLMDTLVPSGSRTTLVVISPSGFQLTYY